ncbi:MAG: glycosyltransferase family 39 protein [Fimbriimonadaceae bacterium]|nr:glycosyltransferase family 39 protein [Fimbriimonadaceae bacterium]
MNSGPAVPVGWRAWWRAGWPAVAPYLVLLSVGLVGLDYGFHDDEPVPIRLTRQAWEQETLLPGWYDWPAMAFNLTTLGSLPEALGDLRLDRRGCSPALSAWLRTDAFKLRCRRLFLALAALTVVWVYYGGYLLAGPVAGTVAAWLLAVSWEFGYHARWVNPDAITTQFTALGLLCLLAFARSGERRWLTAAALVAGVAASSKYQAFLLLPAVLFAARPGRGQPALGTWLRLLGWFTLAFVLVTPGLLLQPLTLLRAFVWQMGHYASGHLCHTVHPGPDHLGRLLRYLGTELFAFQQPLALLWFATALSGGGLLLRRQPRAAFALVGFPLFYLLVCGSQRALFVRNILLVAPPLALLAGYAVAQAAARRRGVLLLAALALLPQLLFAGWAAGTARDRQTDRAARDLAAALRRAPQTTWWLSPAARRQLAAAGEAVPPNALAADPATAARWVALDTEFWPDVTQRPVNQPLSRRWYGPYEINVNWYVGTSNPRLLELTRQRAASLTPAPQTPGWPPR